MSPLSTHFWLLRGLRLCGPSESRHICYEFMIVMFMSCLSDNILQTLSPFCTCSVLSIPPSAMFLGPRGSSVKVMFTADPSTVLYSQHLVQLWIFAFTSIHSKERFLWWRLRVALRRWFYVMSVHLRSCLSDLFSLRFWIISAVLGKVGLLLGWPLRLIMELLDTFLGVMTVLCHWDTSCLVVRNTGFLSA